MAPKSDARARLLNAARQALLKEGLSQVSAQSIYQSLGVSQGSFSHAYPRGLPQIYGILFQELHSALWGGALTTFDLPFDGDASGALWRAQKRLAEVIEEDRQRARLYFELLDRPPASAAHDFVAGAFAADCGRLQDWMAAAVTKGPARPSTSLVHAYVFGQVLTAGRLWAYNRSIDGPSALLAVFNAQSWLPGSAWISSRRIARQSEAEHDLL